MVGRRMSFPDLRGLEMHMKSSKAEQEQEVTGGKTWNNNEPQLSDSAPRWVNARSYIGRSRSIAEITSGTYEESMQTRSSSTQT
eukprot:753986-Hanusia_phi.AAC.4